jgi:hypothetical protein
MNNDGNNLPHDFSALDDLAAVNAIFPGGPAM